MHKIFHNIKQSFYDIFKVWRQEVLNIFKDQGVLIFFLLLPTAYPIVYSLIYNPELVREVPVVVVDNSRTPLSREFTRNINATQNVNVVGYAVDLADAKRALSEKACYGVVYFPADFADKIGRGEQAHLPVYYDMSLLVRYKGILASVVAVSQEMGAKVQTEGIAASAVLYTNGNANPAPSYGFSMGNTEQGFASFLLPGIVVLILQQSMILGIVMLGAGEKERRRRNHGYDPRSVDTGTFNTIIGRTISYVLLYIPSTIYILYFVPRFFMFPQFGDIMQIFMMILPFLFASAFLGLMLQVFVSEREDSFPVIVFTSVIFLFISGLTWPRYAMSPLWKSLSDLVPATWALEGFVKMNGNSATLEQTSTNFYVMWILAIFYFILAYCTMRYTSNRKSLNKLKQ